MTELPAVTDASGRVLDRVAISGLSATGHHGVLADERRNGQVFRCDVVLHLDTRPAAASDDLNDTVDYSAVADAVVDLLAGAPVDLIETLVERVAARCLADARVQVVDATLHKPRAPLSVPFEDVNVSVRRSRDADPHPTP